MVDGKTGIIQTVAGNGRDCCFEEARDARSNTLFAAVSIAIDHDGNIYVADTSSHVRRITAKTGIANTVISDVDGLGADKSGVAPSLPRFERVTGLAIDASDTLYATGSSTGNVYTVSHGVVDVFTGIGGRG
jgi:DNA-binding beta-propeller fold protein YncE